MREVENSPADEEKLREFQALITDLIAQGLTTERVTKTVDIGPPLLPDQAADLGHLIQIEAQGLRLVALDVSDESIQLAPEQRTELLHQGIPIAYQLRKRRRCPLQQTILFPQQESVPILFFRFRL